MKKKSYENILSFIKSLRFRVFMIVTLLVIVPVIISSIFIYNVAVSEYTDKKIDRFKANNTMLKNSIVSEGYLDQNNESQIVDAQIAQLAGEYNCRIQVINSQYIVVSDTDSSELGKTSISESVIKSIDGENIFIKNEKENYVEFAEPLVIAAPSITTDSNKKSSIVGAVYIHYSMDDVVDYKEAVERYVLIIDILLTIFALVTAWGCSVLFNRPIQKMHKAIKSITLGAVEGEQNSKEYTEVAQISDEFSRLVERMNTQDKSRQEFVSNVSHELKTPLTSMKVLAESLIGNEGVPEELYQEFLQDICKEIDRENEIITDLLDLVKMEKTDAEINISSVNINEILETVLKRLKPIAESKNIELVFESFRPVIADVDELKFASVATNLVENAIKYNNTDGTVTASLNSDHQYFYLKVIDTGIGISEEDQERVFERFFRVDKARARQTGGTGLGLAITRDIVLKHHGSIKIHSKEGEGTTFIVRIPLKYIA
ncbi:MAG: cell wall metabolism sensor histidine kinase WalK [Eubacterium sp.]|jgi:signal transduction histidine kinase|nr:cell wall metabolism sensor histidine kinase WalK [Eubacterium sp.]MCI9618227.1 cell wall metabolism sensor histidine kinase WalK [Eubacterium sp.]